MDLRQVWVLYAHEVRSALRERSIVAMSIIVPTVMYPALLWAGFAAFSFIQGQTENLTLRVAIHDLPEAHAPLGDSLRARDWIDVTRWTGTPEEGREDVAGGGLDAFLDFAPPREEGAELAGNFTTRLAFSEARDRSRTARTTLEGAIEDYRDGWIQELRGSLAIPDPLPGDFAVVREDVSTPEEGTRFLLGSLVPFLTLVMVALAAYYPAIDATAGERERSTWETLMTVAAPRSSVAAAKYLYVATFGALGGLLNLTALALSLRWILAPAVGDELGGSGIPLGALPMIAAGTALLGLLVAAGLLVFAVFARNFKEGQSMITPVYLLMILPALFGQSPDTEFTPAIAAVPIVNVALLIREAIMGSVPLVPGAVTFLSMAVCVALAVAFAQWVMRREEVLLGSAEGGLWDFLKRRVRTRRGET